MQMPRLLLVEDDLALTSLLTWHFEREKFEIHHTPNGEEALILARDARPDIVLLDWMIESLPGIEVCQRLRRARDTATVPIIMLTGRGEEADRVKGLDAGADDYVTKPFSPRELLARVLAVLRRTRPASVGDVLKFADLEMDLVSHKVRRSGQVLQVAPTEYRLLRQLLEQPGRAFTRERLLDGVWGRDSEIDLRTVDVHIRRLRLALTAKGGSALIRTVRTVGYALDVEV